MFRRCGLYNLDAVAYESLMLGLFSVWRGQPEARPKINEIVLGYSRDGFHWLRPSRVPFIGVSEDPDAWNWGNAQSAGGPGFSGPIDDAGAAAYEGCCAVEIRH